MLTGIHHSTAAMHFKLSPRATAQHNTKVLSYSYSKTHCICVCSIDSGESMLSVTRHALLHVLVFVSWLFLW